MSVFLTAVLLAQIEGPEEVDAGAKIVLTGEAGSWDLGTVPETRYEVSPDGAMVYIWAPNPERIRVVLTVGKCDDNGLIQFEKHIHEVVVGNAPIPGPNPAPLPDGRYKLAKMAKDAATECPKEHAPIWAKCFRDIASRVASGEIRNKRQLQTEHVKAMKEAIPDTDALKTWEPFDNVWKKRLFELEEAGEMTTMTDFMTAFLELATGLEAVK